MTEKFHEMTFTDAVLKAQAHYYGKPRQSPTAAANDTFTRDEVAFIESRNSFYMATVSETNWPYLQHRGGAAGFLRVTGTATLEFADYEGNRQMQSTGNLTANHRVALFLMDYAARARLKILGHASVVDLDLNSGAEPIAQKVCRLIRVDVVAFDWNCPQYITPRYTAAEVGNVVQPLRQRIAELEARLQRMTSP